MTKVIIVDGVDCSGKTTFIEKLTKDKRFRNALYIKNVYRPSSNNIDERAQIMTKYVEISNIIEKLDFEYIIIDRYFMSEMIYSILRNYDSLNSVVYKLFENIFTKIHKKHLYIQLAQPIKELEKRFNSRGDDYITLKDLEKLDLRYAQFFENTTLNKYVTNGLNPELDFISIIERFEEM